MKAGTLKYIIELYKPTTYTTDFGDCDTHWDFYYKTHANVIYNSGTRTNENSEIFYPTTRTFIVRHYVPVEKTMRVKFGNDYFQIISVNPNKYYNNIEIIADLVNE